MRKLLAAILAIFVSLLGALLLLEGGVRLFKLARPAENPGWFFKVPDPITGWGRMANSEGRWFNELYEFDTYIRYNSRELRAPESLDYAKPAGVYRVMVLGDSFVEALQVDLAQTFFQRFGEHLDGAGMDVEVIGVGAGGWGTDQALLWFENEGVKYQPDTVILAVFPSNDFMDNAEALSVANRGAGTSRSCATSWRPATGTRKRPDRTFPQRCWSGHRAGTAKSWTFSFPKRPNDGQHTCMTHGTPGLVERDGQDGPRQPGARPVPGRVPAGRFRRDRGIPARPGTRSRPGQ